MSNQEIIDAVKRNVELLEERWNSFWDQDYHELARLRAVEQMLRQELAKSPDHHHQRNGATKYRYVERACSKCAKNEEMLERSRARESQQRREIEALTAKVAELELRVARLKEFAPRIKPRDTIQVIPPFEIFDHKNRPVSSLTVAREVRLAHQALHI
jgi:hypothetical protein